MADSFYPIVLIVLICASFVIVILLLTHFIGRNKGSKTDLSPYECGIQPFETARKRFTIKFYLIAMLFILFDIEAAYLYPWAVTFREFADFKLFVFIEMAVFICILFIGFIYVWKRGGLDWDK